MFRKPAPLIDVSPERFQNRVSETNELLAEHFGFRLRSNQVETSRVLLSRSIAELSTGEGKTLAAVVAVSLLAAGGAGVLVCTANDYLARRDADSLRILYDRLGLTTAAVFSGMPTAERRSAYVADITNGTIREFGFDYLRDRVATRDRPKDAPIQRPPACLVVDEADSVLIDEASTPLIISAPRGEVTANDAALYQWAARSVSEFDSETDYVRVGDDGSIALTATGRERAYRASVPPELGECSVLELLHALERAIFAGETFVRDQHYLVKNQKVVIVDEFTGRTSKGRSWGDGIHQAIEASEGVPLTPATSAVAQISVQDYVRKFPMVSGMTGTAREARRELYQVYGLHVQTIPDTHRHSRRETLPSVVLANRSTKWQSIAEETRREINRGRAVLIGTRTIEQSAELFSVLQTHGLDPVVLSATNPEQEAEIISHAGVAGRVTVATNMAGRGTDIALADDVRDAGGLHVIGTELHASARIDRQLAGRGARMGDPGSFRQFVALDDEILSMAYGPEKAAGIARRFQDRSDLSNAMRIFVKAQRMVEHRHHQSRAALAAKTEYLDELYRSLNLDPLLDQFDTSHGR